MAQRRRVMNFQESAVDRLLADYASENGYRIALKMRLRDVIDVDDVAKSARDQTSPSPRISTSWRSTPRR